MSIVDPDRLLLEKAQQTKESEGEQKELDGRMDEERERINGEQDHREETLPQIRQFTGTAALALPPERGQRLDRIDLEVQIRPQSPNGIILYAASSPSSSMEAEQQMIVHNLELANGQPKYSFRIGGEIHEVLLADQKVPLNQWSTIRIINDGKGQSSIRVNSGPPNELYYNPSRMQAPTPGGPVRIFVGGMDPRILQSESASVNFIGAIGRLRLNQKDLNLAEGSREKNERLEGGEDGDAHLDQQENQCSSEPCLNNGQCRLERFGGFQCQCKAGFTGRFCEFPSTDGVCSHDGRRWCHRGICILPEKGSHHPFPFQCLCSPNWGGQRCETFNEPSDINADEEGIQFDGKHSFLAIPLGQSADGGEEATGQGFSVEFRLIPELGKKPFAAGNDEQLVAVLVGMDNAETAAVIGIQSGRLWAMQRKEGDQTATKRFLSKRVKAKKTHRIGLEQSGPGEIHLLIGGKPKGTILGPDSHSPPLLLLGGMPPRGMNISTEIMEHLPKGIDHFGGCLDGLSVNGRKLAWRDLAKMYAANLAKCQPKGEEKESKEELPPPTQPSVPYTPLPVVSISEDPLLTEQEAAERAMMGPEGEPIDGKEEERRLWKPIQLTGTISPDPLPSSTDRPPAIWPTEEEEAMFESAEILSTLEPSTEKPTIDQTTTQETSPSPPTTSEEPEESTSSMEWFTTAFPSIESTTSPWSIEEDEVDQPTTLMPVPATPTPMWMIGPDLTEPEGPFPGLCDPKTCGPHGTCEELNATHVLCSCRDYWVGQTCEQFRPIEYAASFDGNAFVVFSSDEFPHLISDREEVVELKLRTRARYGLIFWQGQQPIFNEDTAMEDFDLTGEDFLSIGLLDGHLAFSYELGGGAAQLISEAPINDGKPHFIRAVRKGRNGTLQVDGGTPIRGRSSGILAMLNVEGHIFVGGVPDLHLMTAGIHTRNFVGCLAELALNGYRLDLMGHAIDGRNVRPCREWRPKRLRRRRQWMRMMLKRQRMRKTAMMKRVED